MEGAGRSVPHANTAGIGGGTQHAKLVVEHVCKQATTPAFSPVTVRGKAQRRKTRHTPDTAMKQALEMLEPSVTTSLDNLPVEASHERTSMSWPPVATAAPPHGVVASTSATKPPLWAAVLHHNAVVVGASRGAAATAPPVARSSSCFSDDRCHALTSPAAVPTNKALSPSAPSTNTRDRLVGGLRVAPGQSAAVVPSNTSVQRHVHLAERRGSWKTRAPARYEPATDEGGGIVVMNTCGIARCQLVSLRDVSVAGAGGKPRTVLLL